MPAIEHLTPPDSPPPQRMSNPRALLDEWRASLQVARLGWNARRLLRAPTSARVGERPLAILIPGYKASEWTLSPLRRYLRMLGHDARHWGLGVNTGDVEADTERLIARLNDLKADSPVVLIGWSLGGVLAREAARQLPQTVERVVTFGTPVVGGPTYTLVAGRWGADECARISARTDELDRDQPLTAAVAAIFSRRDRVVSWAACIDRRSPRVRHYEVGSTHAGLGVDPDVWRVVAEQLALPAPASPLVVPVATY